jgi:peptidyl-prolyl cis-trans isomerase B (cyclophilin B)
MPARATTCAALLAAGAFLAACGGGGSSSVATVVPEHHSSVPGCKLESLPSPKPVEAQVPKPTVKPGQKLTATVSTSCGDFTIDLDTQDSPKTVSEFIYLAKQRDLDNTSFGRVVPDYVIQGGNAQLTGPKGRSFTSVEPPPSNISYRRGDVAMAKGGSDPIGAGSGEFFVVTAPSDAGLPDQYALLGKVSSGMDTVTRISKLADPSLGAGGGTPLQPVVLHSVTIH